MKNPDEAKWVEQAKELLGKGAAAEYEMPRFATSMLAYFYGSNSAQARSFQQLSDSVWKDKAGGAAFQLFRHAKGAVQSTLREIENGLVGSLRTAAQGELLGDLVGMAREALVKNTDDTKMWRRSSRQPRLKIVCDAWLRKRQL